MRALWLVFAISSGALAAESADAPLLPPELRLEGKTEGAAEARLSYSFFTPDWTSGSAKIKLSAVASTSDGATTFLSLVSGTKKSELSAAEGAELGATVSFAFHDAAEPLAQRQSNNVRDSEKKNAIYDSCVQESDCANAPSGDAFCDWRKAQLAEEQESWAENIIQPVPPPAPPKYQPNERTLDVEKWLKAESFCPSQRKGVEALYKRLEAAGGPPPESAFDEATSALLACATNCSPGTLPKLEDIDWCKSDLPRLVPFPAAPSRERINTLDEGHMCPAGQKQWQDYVRSGPNRRRLTRFPPAMLNVGGRVGGKTFKHLAPVKDEADLYTSTSTLLGTATFGASGYHLFRVGGRTFSTELLARYENDAKGAQDTVRWCVPSGSVQNKDDTIGPAEVCKELARRAPTRTKTVILEGYVGLVDEVDEAFRIRAGLTVEAPKGGTRSWKLSVPTTIRIAGGEEGLFKGLIQLAPGITWARNTEGKTETTLGLTFALLGQPRLFTEEFDRL